MLPIALSGVDVSIGRRANLQIKASPDLPTMYCHRFPACEAAKHIISALFSLIMLPRHQLCSPAVLAITRILVSQSYIRWRRRMAKETAASSDRDVEALAADEDSPLLTTDVDGHETVQARAARFKCLYTTSLSGDSSATSANSDGEDSPEVSQTKQNVASMICLLLIGMTFLYIFLVARSSTHVSAPLHLHSRRLAQLSHSRFRAICRHSLPRSLTTSQGLSSPAPTATS